MMKSVPLGVFVPGNTLVHRLPVGWKFLLLIAFIVSTAVWVKSPLIAALCFLLPLLGYAIARIPLRVAWGQLWPPFPILAFLFAFQWWQLGFSTAAATVLNLYAAIAAATLLTLTTPLGAMMDAFEAFLEPTRKWGLPVDNIILAISLTLRLIPLQLATVYEVLDARKARGAEFSILAFGTPVLIRSIRRARNIGDALVARGVGD